MLPFASIFYGTLVLCPTGSLYFFLPLVYSTVLHRGRLSSLPLRANLWEIYWKEREGGQEGSSAWEKEVLLGEM
jgi:hypothetical protein